jgi:hypothetical protein
MWLKRPECSPNPWMMQMVAMGAYLGVYFVV